MPWRAGAGNGRGGRRRARRRDQAAGQGPAVVAMQRRVAGMQRSVDPLRAGRADEAFPVGVQRPQGGLVGAGDAGIVVQQQDGVAVVLGSPAEAEIQPAQRAFAQDLVRDAPRHAPHQGQHGTVHVVGRAGQVQDAEDFARGGEDGRGVAAEDAVAGQEMLRAVDAHGAAVVQGRADGVGAAQGFGPADAGLQRHAMRLVLEAAAAAFVQDQAAGVGQQHDAVRRVPQRAQRAEAGFGQAQQMAVGFAADVQVGAGQGIGVGQQGGVQVGAARPGLVDARRRLRAGARRQVDRGRCLHGSLRPGRRGTCRGPRRRLSPFAARCVAKCDKPMF